jgi:hypothetical protein
MTPREQRKIGDGKMIRVFQYLFDLANSVGRMDGKRERVAGHRVARRSIVESVHELNGHSL